MDVQRLPDPREEGSGMIIYIVTTPTNSPASEIHAAFELRENAERWVSKQPHPSHYDIEAWHCKDREVMDNV